MGCTEIEQLKCEVRAWEKLYRHADKCASEWAEKCGMLSAKLSLADYRTEKARREIARITGLYDPKWPNLSGWEIIQSDKEVPEYIISNPIVPEQKVEEDDILSLFKQSSNQI